MRAHSATADFVKLLVFVSKYESKSPNNSPIPNELSPRLKKSRVMIGMAANVNPLSTLFCFVVYVLIVLKRIIDTASLVMPSPKTKLNNFGYYFGLIKLTAAMTSDEQSRLHMRRTSVMLNETRLVTQVPLVGSREVCCKFRCSTA